MEIPKELKDEIKNYCGVNGIPNIDEFTLKLIKQGFTVEKFGATPVANEKIVEKVVEKIVEVPVEKIIEKEVYVTNDDQVKDLMGTLNEKESEIIELRGNLDTDEVEMNKFRTTIGNLNEQIGLLTKQLEEEKNKKQKDIYGE